MTTLTTLTTLVPASGASGTPEPDRARENGGAARALSVFGGLALALGPLLIIAGTLTTPPQASSSQADYIRSLTVDPFMTNLAANLYHYGWVALTFGFLAAVGLVPGRRGRVLALIGGIGSSLGALQMSGLLYCDWSDGSAGRIVGTGAAVAISQATAATPSMVFWLGSAKLLALVFPLVLFLGLARAGVMRWWVGSLVLGAMVGGVSVFLAVGGVLGGVLSVAVSLVCYLPAFIAARRLVQPGRTA